MIVKWWKQRPKGWKKSLSANLLGASISFTVLLVLFLTRIESVWPVFVFMPIMIYVFHRTRHHYRKVGPQLRIDETMDLPDFKGNAVIICVSDTTKVVEVHYNMLSLLVIQSLLFIFLLIKNRKKNL